MIRINLLPTGRKNARPDASSSGCLPRSPALAGLAVWFCRPHDHRRLRRWSGREERLPEAERSSNSTRRIAEIKGLREQAEALLSRKR